MGPLGVPELAIILVIIVIIFGVGKLPEIGGALGKGIKEFKSESGVAGGKDDELETGDSEKASSLTANSSASKSEEVGARTERREVRADEI